MKCLTVCQPYAHLLIHRPDIKPAEYRTWATRWRGPVLIHAGQSHRWYQEATFQEVEAAPENQVHYGAIIGAVCLSSVVPIEHGEFMWNMSLPLAFDAPVRWCGQKGLYSVVLGPELINAISAAAHAAAVRSRETTNYWLNVLIQEVEAPKFGGCSAGTLADCRTLKSLAALAPVGKSRMSKSDGVVISKQVTHKFSLVCYSCSAGEDVKTIEEARSAGWKDIVEDFEGLSWNYVGICPDCLKERH